MSLPLGNLREANRHLPHQGYKEIPVPIETPLILKDEPWTLQLPPPLGGLGPDPVLCRWVPGMEGTGLWGSRTQHLKSSSLHFLPCITRPSLIPELDHPDPLLHLRSTDTPPPLLCSLPTCSGSRLKSQCFNVHHPQAHTGFRLLTL